ncbi:MAG: aspartate aminotransferase family protein [Deltaproteobacteria bacterium]|nr:aspartate aminotransferase family protein [Deltaproteobacteria bacterium]MBW2153776.1 aspartate aminotransferase family protein [Deltaproteobacteria bacterium]
MKTKRSQLLLQEYGEIVTGGVHSNFRVPRYFKKAHGSRMWDVDDNEYIDCTVNNGACILGHGDPDVNAEVIKAVKKGLTVGVESEMSMKAARLLHEMIPSAEQVRFANSGSEAVMKALMIARAFTGKEKIIKMEGGYHGWFDEAQVSVHPDPATAGPANAPEPVLSTAGIRRNTKHNVLVTSFNDLGLLERLLAAYKDEIAAILMEPVMFNCGCILPKPGYLEGVRQLADKFKVILIFDEVVTGFRLAPGGGQERFGVVPDMSVFAKAIANGYPLAAVVGRKDLMELSRPGGSVLYGGTYNGQQSAVAAAAACLEKLKDGRVQQRLEEMTQKLSEEFQKRAKIRNIHAQLIHCGGQFQVFFTDHEIKDYRMAFSVDQRLYHEFFHAVIDNGIWFNKHYLFHHGVTYAHSDEDISLILSAFDKGLEVVKHSGK